MTGVNLESCILCIGTMNPPPKDKEPEAPQAPHAPVASSGVLKGWYAKAAPLADQTKKPKVLGLASMPIAVKARAIPAEALNSNAHTDAATDTTWPESATQPSRPMAQQGVQPQQANPRKELAHTLLTSALPSSKPASDQSPIEAKKKKLSHKATLASEWDPTHFRMFIGNLGNEVTDKLLTDTFSQYKTFEKAKVVRDGKSNKTKGYGFASFRDAKCFLKAMKEWNGKYIGTRPCTITRSKRDD